VPESWRVSDTSTLDLPEVAPVPELGGLLSSVATHAPDRTALRDRAGTVSRAELARLADAAAVWLGKQGVRHGDRVLVRATADRITVAALFGCLRSGAVFVPYSTDTTRYQLDHLLADAEPAFLLTDDVRQLGWADVRGGIPAGLLAAADTTAPEVPDRTITPDDLALLLYTSGSTSRPKAVACTHGQVSFAANAVASSVRYHPEDVVFCRVPLSFDYGLYQTFLTFLAGGTLVLSDSSRDSRLLSDLAAHQATVLPVVPSLATMLLTLATRPNRPELPALRLFTNTGEHLSPAVVAALRRAFPTAGVQLMFGTTECKRITVLEIDGDLEHPGSVGRPLRGTSVHIVGVDGRELPPGQTGEITVRGPHLMAGYWRAPELTAERYRVDDAGERFLLTGDFGHVDADGHLYFEGRRDHLFKLRGVRTSTVEIEEAAGTLPEVTQAAVLTPTPDREAVLCVVTSVTPEEVLAALRERLGPAKVPASCRVVDAIPLTANGKMDRVALRRFVDGDAS
jgi:amino acid adenylation domain-containing protein